MSFSVLNLPLCWFIPCVLHVTFVTFAPSVITFYFKVFYVNLTCVKIYCLPAAVSVWLVLWMCLVSTNWFTLFQKILACLETKMKIYFYF